MSIRLHQKFINPSNEWKHPPTLYGTLPKTNLNIHKRRSFIVRHIHSDIFRPKWQFYDNLATSKAILTITINENTLQLSMVHLQKQILVFRKYVALGMTS